MTSWIDVVTSVNRNIVKILESHSEVLASIDLSFQRLLSRREAEVGANVICFHEELAVRTIGFVSRT